MKGECDVVNMGTLYKCVQGCVRVCVYREGPQFGRQGQVSLLYQL